MALRSRKLDRDLSDVAVADAYPGVDVAPGGTSRTVAADRIASRVAVRVASFIVAAAIIVAIWSAISAGLHMSTEVLPTPWAVWKATVANIGALGQNSVPTAVLAVLGFLAAGVLGVPLGWCLARPSRLGAVLNSGVLFAQVFPKIAIAPLLLVWFGFGYFPKILFVFLLCFFPITVNAAAGFASIPTEVRDLAAMLRLRGWARLRKIDIPAALPNIFAGLKISASFAIVAEIVFEFVGSNTGLGYFALNTETTLNVSLMFGAFGAIALLGFALYGVVALAEALLIPWHVSRRQGTAASGGARARSRSLRQGS
jgi:NitT/TauT family transport system permease protein